MDKHETWESTIDGTVVVKVRDRRTPGAWRSQRVGGKSTGTHRLHITREEREYNQEIIPERNSHLDPFTNGTLVCTAGRADDTPKSRYELTDADLMEMLRIDDDEVFMEAARTIEIELPLRRLLDLAERHCTIARYQQLRALIADRYPIGGTQRTVQEMIEAGEKIGATMMT